MENSLIALSNDLAAAAENAGKYVAAIHARPRFSSSGIILRPGVIVTADHTVRRDEQIRVTLPGGESVTAEIAGRDPGTDLAVLKADTGRAAAATLAAPDGIKTGNLVLAIGRVQETGVNAALGIVSSVAGPWHTWRGSRVEQFIRLDLGLYPGSSGGAVVDVHGQVVGIATTGLSRTSVLAIPGVTITRVAEELLTKGHVSRGFLGVGLQPIALPEHLIRKLPAGSASGGLIVLSVEPGGPAAEAGMLLGDVLTSLDGKSMEDTDGVQGFLSAGYVGKPVKAGILRGGEPVELNITIAERKRRTA